MPVDDSNTISLLAFDGDDASTDFVDESGKLWTAYGAAQLDTAQKVYGSASGLFNGSAATYITTPFHSDFAIGGGDWTVDLRVRFNSVAQGALVQIGLTYGKRIVIY